MVSVLEQYGCYDYSNHCTTTKRSRASLNVSVTGGKMECYVIIKMPVYEIGDTQPTNSVVNVFNDVRRDSYFPN